MIELTRQQALKYRAAIIDASTSLTNTEALKAPMLFERWEIGRTYAIGERIYYNGVLYSVLEAHTSQSDWTPDISPSLFAEVLIPDPVIIPEWVQPDSTNAYKLGDKVTHNGKTWISDYDNNVWEPGVYGWSEVQ